jgi:DNA-binding transcriptional ArsR family regulator
LNNYSVEYVMSDHLSETLIALADPTRRAILARLATGAATVNELAEPFDMTVQAVSKHIKMLERGGLVIRTREAQSRPCQIQAGALKDVADWLERYRKLWDERLDRLGDYLKEIQKKDREKDDGR